MNLDPLFELSRQLLRQLDRPQRRRLEIAASVKRLLVTGPRGVGKSTWIAQQVVAEFPDFEESRKCLYLPVDHFRVSGLPLYDIAEEFALMGGELLCLDEVHRSENWSRDLKSIADTFPELRVLVSGSSLLRLQKGSHDISRRYVVAPMAGLSFREYLQLRHQLSLQPLALEEILHEHERQVPPLLHALKAKNLHVLECFSAYLESGVYPYSFEFEGTATFAQTLQQSVAVSIESDLPAVHPNLTGASIQRIRFILLSSRVNSRK